MREPLWLDRRDVEVMHAALLSRLGGAPGVRDEGLIESALARPRNRFAYDAETTMFALAASYFYGLIKNHGFVDGNKRIGFTAAGVFLRINGFKLIAPEPAAYEFVDGLAAGRYSEDDAVEWLRANSQPK